MEYGSRKEFDMLKKIAPKKKNKKKTISKKKK
jgi:hypothetical protein